MMRYTLFVVLLLINSTSYAEQKFTEQLWQENLPLYNKIVSMPFNQELVKGTLAKEKFAYYIMQDDIYLKYYAKVLEILANKSSNMEERKFLLEASKGSLTAEKVLHNKLLKQLGVNEKETFSQEEKPATSHYASYLLATVYDESYEVGLAAILPCFWIYMEVGKYMKNNLKSGHNVYKEWIEEYSSPDFEEKVKILLGYVDRHASKAPNKTKLAMQKAYKTASRLEYKFWEDAYNNAGWIK